MLCQFSSLTGCNRWILHLFSPFLSWIQCQGSAAKTWRLMSHLHLCPSCLFIFLLYISFFFLTFSSSAFQSFFFLPPFFSTSNFVHRSDDFFPYYLCLPLLHFSSFSRLYNSASCPSPSHSGTQLSGKAVNHITLCTGPIRIQYEGASLQSDCQLLASSCCRAETIETDGQQMEGL